MKKFTYFSNSKGTVKMAEVNATCILKADKEFEEMTGENPVKSKLLISVSVEVLKDEEKEDEDFCKMVDDTVLEWEEGQRKIEERWDKEDRRPTQDELDMAYGYHVASLGEG